MYSFVPGIYLLFSLALVLSLNEILTNTAQLSSFPNPLFSFLSPPASTPKNNHYPKKISFKKFFNKKKNFFNLLLVQKHYIKLFRVPKYA